MNASAGSAVIASDGHVAADGRAGWGFTCSCGQQGSASLPVGTASHEAEWRGVAEALRHVRSHAPGSIALQVDSALVAKGLAARRPAMHGPAAEVRAACRQALAQLADQGLHVEVQRVPRERNQAADALARRAAQG